MRFPKARPDRSTTGRRLGRLVPAVVATAVATALVLSGCSSAGSANAAGSSASSVSCKSKQKVKIMMGTSNLDVSYTPYAGLAKELGYFDQECLDVTVGTVGTSVTTAQALQGGTADIAMQSPDALILASQTNPLPIKIFYNLIPKSIYTLAVAPGSDIKSFADLKGKTIGVTGLSGVYDAYLGARLKEAGLKLSDVKETAVGYGATPMEALKKGSIDAFLAWPGLWASYKNAGYKFTLLPEASWQGEYYGIGLGATTAYITKHPDVIEKVSRAVAKASVYVKKNPDAAVKLFWKDYPTLAPLPGTDETKALKQDRAILDSTVAEMELAKRSSGYQLGTQSTATWQRQIDFDAAAGLVTKKVSPSDFFTNAYNAKANDFDWSTIK